MVRNYSWTKWSSPKRITPQPQHKATRQISGPTSNATAFKQNIFCISKWAQRPHNSCSVWLIAARSVTVDLRLFSVLFPLPQWHTKWGRAFSFPLSLLPTCSHPRLLHFFTIPLFFTPYLLFSICCPNILQLWLAVVYVCVLVFISLDPFCVLGKWSNRLRHTPVSVLQRPIL